MSYRGAWATTDARAGAAGMEATPQPGETSSASAEPASIASATKERIISELVPAGVALHRSETLEARNVSADLCSAPAIRGTGGQNQPLDLVKKLQKII